MGKFINDSIDKLLVQSEAVLITYSFLSGRFSTVSSSIEHILGYSADDILGMAVPDLVGLIHEEDQAEWENDFNALFQVSAPNEPVTMSFRLRAKDGTYKLLELRSIIEILDGKPVELYFLIQDLSHFKDADRSLKQKNVELDRAKMQLSRTNQQLSSLNEKLEKHNLELEEIHEKLIFSEEIFRQVAENTNDVFWLRDNQNIIYINNQFEKIWGRKKEELIENPYKITEWIHPEDLTDIEPWVNLNSLPDDSPYTEHYRIVRPDGEVRWLWSRIFPVKDKTGRKYRLVGIASDITEQKEYEEALTIAKEKAQESDMLKSSFLANISHEIRTPMNGIIGFSELLSREDIDSDTRQSYVNIMKKSSEQLIRIIDDIIDFAKLEANQIRIEKASMNINTMLDQLLTQYNNQLGIMNKASVTLLVNKALPDVASSVISDEQRVRQVLMHLLDNACKYTVEGFIEFGYTLSGEQVEFFVKDSGIGIPGEKFDLIFEQFRQGDEGHTRRYGGTGLGLPIAKALVNLLGGSIRLESVPEKGSTFYFTIPFEAQQKSTSGDEPFGYDKLKYNWKEKLILVAEDDELNFEYMKVLLEPTQAKVIRAKDGSQAIKMCSNLNFDVILMDIRLPVLNGIQATKRLREMGIVTPIIAQTAYAMDDDEKKCLDAGCTSYLAKPISKERLFKIIDSVL
ncbi:MAG: PAS domain-containing protein [Bacteroidales bacterium]|nr:PAS domain-containing protein [Bacteroidales bacterium]